jgi:hypothetical protein
MAREIKGLGLKYAMDPNAIDIEGAIDFLKNTVKNAP